MKYSPDIHHRRSIRLKGYDYSQAGAYFVTLCTQNKECLLGEITKGKVGLSPYGQIVHEEWIRTAEIRKEIIMDLFVVMPNHLHGIVFIHLDGNRPVGAHGRAPASSLVIPSESCCLRQLRRRGIPQAIHSLTGWLEPGLSICAILSQ